MARAMCNGCLGTYRDVGRDGVPYFHVCPPEIVVRAQLEDRSVDERPLPAWAAITLVADAAAKAALVANGADPATIAIELARRRRRRAGHRDEQTAGRAGERGEIRVLRSEGAGVTEIADLPDPEEL